MWRMSSPKICGDKGDNGPSQHVSVKLLRTQLWISEPAVGCNSLSGGFPCLCPKVCLFMEAKAVKKKIIQAFELHFSSQSVVSSLSWWISAPPPRHHPSSPSWCGVLFMINRDNSVLWCHLLWLLHLRATRSSYWLSARPALHFVSVSGSPRDRRARQSYKVKCLGLAPALQVSVIILLEAFLLCWIIMEVGVVGLSPLKCGWRKQTRGAEKCLLCCYAIWRAWHQSKPALCPARRAGLTADSPTSLFFI